MYGVIRAEWIRGVAWASRPRPWVARLTGLDDRWCFCREFVSGVYDYTYARRSGGRGIYLYFALAPGYYEVYRPISWRSDQRFFCHVTEDGDWHEVSREEVVACLTNATSASAS